MKPSEVSKAVRQWRADRVGISPAAGNNLDAMASKGTLIREIIAVYDNGIKTVGYRDHQNRLAGVQYEPTEFVPVAEYAKAHGVTPATMCQRIARGASASAKKIGNNWVIDRDEVYVDGRRR